MNEKELREKRDQIVEQMQAITDNATNVEKRTLTTEEQQKFAGLKKEVEDIDATLEAMEQSRTLLPPVKRNRLRISKSVPLQTSSETVLTRTSPRPLMEP